MFLSIPFRLKKFRNILCVCLWNAVYRIFFCNVLFSKHKFSIRDIQRCVRWLFRRSDKTSPTCVHTHNTQLWPLKWLFSAPSWQNIVSKKAPLSFKPMFITVQYLNLTLYTIIINLTGKKHFFVFVESDSSTMFKWRNTN